MACKEWNIKPWEFEKLTTAQVQDIELAAHAERYIQEELRSEYDGTQMRSQTNSQSHQAWREEMKAL